MLTRKQQRPSYPRSQSRSPKNLVQGVGALDEEVRKFQEIINVRKNIDDLLGGGYAELRNQRTEAIRIGKVVLQHGIVTRMFDLVLRRISTLKAEENELHGLRLKTHRIGDRGLEGRVVRLVQENMRQARWLSQEQLIVEAILADLKPRVERELHWDD